MSKFQTKIILKWDMVDLFTDIVHTMIRLNKFDGKQLNHPMGVIRKNCTARGCGYK